MASVNRGRPQIGGGHDREFVGAVFVVPQVTHFVGQNGHQVGIVVGSGIHTAVGSLLRAVFCSHVVPAVVRVDEVLSHVDVITTHDDLGCRCTMKAAPLGYHVIGVVPRDIDVFAGVVDGRTVARLFAPLVGRFFGCFVQGVVTDIENWGRIVNNHRASPSQGGKKYQSRFQGRRRGHNLTTTQPSKIFTESNLRPGDRYLKRRAGQDTVF